MQKNKWMIRQFFQKKRSHSLWMAICHSPSGCLALLFLSFFIGGSIFFPWFTGNSCYITNLLMKNTPPSWEYLCGTDDLGRSLFLRIWQGGRVSLGIALTAAIIDFVIGFLFGSFAALKGGKTEKIMVQLIDIFQSLPSLLIVILLIMLFGPGMHTMIIAISLTGWLNMARTVRATVNHYKHSLFVENAIAMKASIWYIMWHHILPNIGGAILAAISFTIPYAIFTEAFLSFLGIGIQPPLASWGTMANDGLTSLYFYPWRLAIPASCISLTIFSFYLLGDLIRDFIDPKREYASY